MSEKSAGSMLRNLVELDIRKNLQTVELKRT